MKKRLLVILLTVALLLPAVLQANAAASICFAANNDTVPAVLTDGETPYYSGSKLYIPYTAFRASPNGVGASYNPDKNTFVLFNRNETLIFDLKAKTFTDSQGKTYTADLAFRGGILYLSTKVAEHFGLSVTLLYSRKGYPIVRFTDGGQVYDDGMFVAQAENLINQTAEKYLRENKPTTQGKPSGQTGEQTDPQGVDLYLAFTGDAVSSQTLELLKAYRTTAAFFLTYEQILEQKELVWKIYAEGHTVGLTVSSGESDPAAALQMANDALDQVLFCRSVFVLLPAGTSVDAERWHILREPQRIPIADVMKAPQGEYLYVVRSDSTGVLSTAIKGGASILLLTETSF